MCELEDDLNGFAKEIAEEYGYPVPTVSLTSRFKRKWGMCYISKLHIKLNRYFCENNEFQVVYDLLKHEIAHLDERTYGEVHGPMFKMVCAEMGIAERTFIEHPDYVKEEGRYTYMCPGCGMFYHFFRPLKRIGACGVCSKGHYNPAFKLIDVTA